MIGSGRCVVRLYVRPGCHLCEDMWLDLQALRVSRGFDLEVVDITGSPGLEAAHGKRVPVLEADGKEICNFYLDPQALLNHLECRQGTAI